MKEKRNYLRIQLSVPVECRVPRQKRYFNTVSKDLSLGGIKIVSDKFISQNDSFKLTVNLIERVLNLKVRVVWCSKERSMDRFSVGLEFIEMNRNDRKFLSQFLNNVYPA